MDHERNNVDSEIDRFSFEFPNLLYLISHLLNYSTNQLVNYSITLAYEADWGGIGEQNSVKIWTEVEKLSCAETLNLDKLNEERKLKWDFTNVNRVRSIVGISR